MSDESTPDPASAWSADDPVETPDIPAETSDPPGEPETPEERGTRAERRSARDQSTRDDNARTQLGEERARAERLAQQVDTMRQTELMRHVGEHLAHPDDLLLATTAEQRAAVWNDDGSLDEGAMAALVDGVLDQRPHWKKPVGGSMDMGSGYKTPGSSSSSATWSDVIRG